MPEEVPALSGRTRIVAGTLRRVRRDSVEMDALVILLTGRGFVTLRVPSGVVMEGPEGRRVA